MTLTNAVDSSTTPTENRITSEERVEDAVRRLRELDLSGVRLKLADPLDGPGWDTAMIETIQRDYLRFLALCCAYPDEKIVPSRDVDKFWHQHILDTHAYAEDTRRVFGRFLHHNPYFGTAPQTCEDLESAYSMTRSLYRRHFGVSISSSVSQCGGGDRCSSCAGPK